jgi:hypothetical protein
MHGKPRSPGNLQRLARLLVSRSALRRRSDRIERAALIVVLAGLLVGAAAGGLLGMHVYQAQRANAARLRPVTAVLSQSGPIDDLTGTGQARARWRAPDGRERAGPLTPVTAPGIWGAPAGTRVRVWVTSAGVPEAPQDSLEAFSLAALVGTLTAGGSAVALAIWYWLCRLLLDRQRLRAWECAWAAIEPRWTGRH